MARIDDLVKQNMRMIRRHDELLQVLESGGSWMLCWDLQRIYFIVGEELSDAKVWYEFRLVADRLLRHEVDIDALPLTLIPIANDLSAPAEALPTGEYSASIHSWRRVRQVVPRVPHRPGRHVWDASTLAIPLRPREIAEDSVVTLCKTYSLDLPRKRNRFSQLQPVSYFEIEGNRTQVSDVVIRLPHAATVDRIGVELYLDLAPAHESIVRIHSEIAEAAERYRQQSSPDKDFEPLVAAARNTYNQIRGDLVALFSFFRTLADTSNTNETEDSKDSDGRDGTLTNTARIDEIVDRISTAQYDWRCSDFANLERWLNTPRNPDGNGNRLTTSHQQSLADWLGIASQLGEQLKGVAPRIRLISRLENGHAGLSQLQPMPGDNAAPELGYPSLYPIRLNELIVPYSTEREPSNNKLRAAALLALLSATILTIALPILWLYARTHVSVPCVLPEMSGWRAERLFERLRSPLVTALVVFPTALYGQFFQIRPVTRIGSTARSGTFALLSLLFALPMIPAALIAGGGSVVMAAWVLLLVGVTCLWFTLRVWRLLDPDELEGERLRVLLDRYKDRP